MLGEIQSEEHSRAFFQALAAGVRGLQTFHSSSPEQAIRRWLELHGVSKANLADLGVIVQMQRPQRLSSRRCVQSISTLGRTPFSDPGEARAEPALNRLFVRATGCPLVRTASWEQMDLATVAIPLEEFLRAVETKIESIGEMRAERAALD